MSWSDVAENLLQEPKHQCIDSFMDQVFQPLVILCRPTISRSCAHIKMIKNMEYVV